MIFESPDNGKTIFGRHTYNNLENGDYIHASTKITSLSQALERKLVQEDNNMRKKKQDESFWKEIREAAKTNTDLQEILNQAIMLYTLCKEE